MAGRERRKGGESRLDDGGGNIPHPLPEERPRGAKSPRWSAERRGILRRDAHASAQRACAQCAACLRGVTVGAPLGAPSPSHFCAGVDSPAPPFAGATPRTPVARGGNWEDGAPAPLNTGPAELCVNSPHPEARVSKDGPHGSRRVLRTLLTMRGRAVVGIIVAAACALVWKQQ
jgi:hypothetical protein